MLSTVRPQEFLCILREQNVSIKYYHYNLNKLYIHAIGNVNWLNRVV